MQYQFCPDDDHANRMIERHSGSEVVYCSKRRLHQLHPSGNYRVIGEIGNCSRPYAKQESIASDSGRSVPIFPLGSCRRPLEWIVGYASIGEGLYVAVIKGMIPLLFRRKQR